MNPKPEVVECWNKLAMDNALSITGRMAYIGANMITLSQEAENASKMLISNDAKDIKLAVGVLKNMGTSEMIIAVLKVIVEIMDHALWKVTSDDAVIKNKTYLTINSGLTRNQHRYIYLDS